MNLMRYIWPMLMLMIGFANLLEGLVLSDGYYDKIAMLASGWSFGFATCIIAVEYIIPRINRS